MVAYVQEPGNFSSPRLSYPFPYVAFSVLKKSSKSSSSSCFANASIETVEAETYVPLILLGTATVAVS